MDGAKRIHPALGLLKLLLAEWTVRSAFILLWDYKLLAGWIARSAFILFLGLLKLLLAGWTARSAVHPDLFRTTHDYYFD
ncbi:hypothetical protein H6F42_15315 [Pseudanabaena sp. FACHB-1998]|uniref:hypothetical protein n=1 Tax=Pseudanabaena sp. FACHB-1998 TaxID=2692858 RepID=UPI00168187D2|nr:hypothetical protein [Pseudanabaena sp. FACHB-1998]MBD2178286.1 hypothetical protein [Pseudanabaena sp. FACHB-1998]